jgi:hypothetical protein
MEHHSAANASALQAVALAYGSTADQSTSIPRVFLPREPDELIDPSSLGLGGRKTYSKEQWDAQKPVIRRLYNEENKPFKRVIEILRMEHNFVPT